MPSHPLFDRLRAQAAGGPIVVAHRGDSRAWPENTIGAFQAAVDLGTAMIEFDVRCTSDDVPVCIHDATFDRTTNAATHLGPGALVANTTLARARELDAGSWHAAQRGHSIVPTLAEALEVMLPLTIPLIEHKAGSAETYVAALRRLECVRDCILQSFDWRFIAAARDLEPELAVAALGPTRGIDRPDSAALQLAAQCGAGMMHWHDRALSAADVDRIHAAGMLVCTYTTDDEPGWRGGAALGIDAMCTNVPARMRACLRGSN